MSETPNRKKFAAERHSAVSQTAATASPIAQATAQFDAAASSDAATLALEVAALREEMSGLKQQISDAVAAISQASAPSPAPTPAVIADAESGSDQPEDASITAVQLEIARLVRSMAQAKSELAAIKHPLADDDRLLAASNELDAIVRATEVATQDILGAAEEIERITALLSGSHPDDEELQNRTNQIIDHIVSIMEASNFQDITGQRINKVVSTVRFIEERVLSMINIWGVEAFVDLPMPNTETGTDDDLLNGPQLENRGISQADIDALFD